MQEKQSAASMAQAVLCCHLFEGCSMFAYSLCLHDFGGPLRLRYAIDMFALVACSVWGRVYGCIRCSPLHHILSFHFQQVSFSCSFKQQRATAKTSDESSVTTEKAKSK